MVAHRSPVTARPGRLLVATLTLLVLTGCTSHPAPGPGPSASPDAAPSPTSTAPAREGAQTAPPSTGREGDDHPTLEELRTALVDLHAPLMVLQPPGFSTSHPFQARDGWTVLSSNGVCALSSATSAAPADGPEGDVPGAARDASFAVLREVLAAERGARSVSAESEAFVLGEERTEPRTGTNVATQEWTVERAGAPVRSRVLARATTSVSYSGVTMRTSTVLSFECAGVSIDETAWAAVLEWLRLPATAREVAGEWTGA